MEENLLFKPRSMSKNPFYMAPVDIIIPFHGKQNLVGRLMESIFMTVRTNRYQISLVDDASPNNTFLKQFKKVRGVVGFRNERQLGFGASINVALVQTKQPYVLIIQSDVVVQGSNWLSKMGESLFALKDQGVRMVAPLTDNSVVKNDLLQVERKKMNGKDVVLMEGFLPMYCCLSHRDLYQRMGPLKEYPYAGGEAEEFAARMRHKGLLQAVCGSSWVHHDGGATLTNFENNQKVQEILRKTEQRIQEDINSWKK